MTAVGRAEGRGRMLRFLRAVVFVAITILPSLFVTFFSVIAGIGNRGNCCVILGNSCGDSIGNDRGTCEGTTD